MASSSKKNHSRGLKIGSLIGSLVAFVVVVAIIVESGAYGRLAKSLGLPEINGVSQLMPGEDSQQKNDLQLDLKTPSVSVPSVTSSPSVSASAEPSTAEKESSSSGTFALPEGASSPYSVQKALEVAQTIPTATPHADGYNRSEQFGTWINSADMCGSATTRDYILKRDLTNVEQNSKCQVTSGNFNDPYTGKSMTFTRGQNTSSLIQIDHVVALNDAYASGLYKDSRASERVTYANDPEVLVASEGTANNVKGNGVNLKSAGAGSSKWEASTPSVWLPSYEPYQCEYMAKRVYIKDKYDLTMSTWEKSETVSFLKQCAAN